MRLCSLLAVVMLAVALIGCEKSDPNTELLQSFHTQLAQPAYAKLVSVTELNQARTQQCDPQNLASFLTDAQQSWRQTMAAWQEARVIRFGPIVEQRLDWEFQFWPDKKNLVAKKALALLKKDQPLDEQTLEKSSVVLHGLSALEFMLFDPSAQEKAQPERFCELTQWIGQALHTNAQRLQKSWDQQSSEFLAPGDQSEFYPTFEVALGKIVDSYLITLENVSKQKIGSVIGEHSESKANPYFLESWRSENSWQNISANLIATHRFFHEGGFLSYLQSLGHESLATELNGALLRVNQKSAQVKAPLFSQLDEKSPALRELQSAVINLKNLLKNKATDALNLPIGFNDNDGD